MHGFDELTCNACDSEFTNVNWGFEDVNGGGYGECAASW